MEILTNIIKAQQFNRNWIEGIFFNCAQEMEGVVKAGGTNVLEGKKMVTFFYEPSTRTRASFEFAMHYLGGKVVFSTENAQQFSSVSKGESLQDTIVVLNQYEPDIIVLRYHEEGGAMIAAGASRAPIINAGDGNGQHPTQALLDIYTIQKKMKRIDDLNIAMVGDLRNGRTVRSLCYLLAKFSDIKIYFVSPESMRIKQDVKDDLRKQDVVFAESDDLREVAGDIDVIYQTRAQGERGTAVDEINDAFRIDKEVLKLMHKEAIILHPLPRNNEIAMEVDSDPRAVYLTDQVKSGLYTRMALLKMILSEK